MASSRVLVCVSTLLSVSACGGSKLTQSSPPAPLTVTAIAPNFGLTSGALTVVILGTGFQAGAIVTIGEAATHVVFNSSTALSVVTATHGAGPVDVVVTNPGGETARLGLAFTYRDPAPPPTITRVEPQTALMTGGTDVRIDGTGFRNKLTLTVGGDVGVPYGLAGDTITAHMRAHAPGLVDITVTNDDGQSATLAGALTYQTIEDFDFSGSWEGGAVFQNEQMPFQLAIEHNHVVSFTCGTSGAVVLDPAPLLRNGNFAYTGANGLTIDGRIDTDTDFDGIPYLKGTVNAPSCKGTRWYAYRK